MRLSFGGDPRECQNWVGKAQQELFRLQQRMSTQGQTQGAFHKILAPGVECIGYVLPNGMQVLHVNATSVAGEKVEEAARIRPDHFFEFFTSGRPAQKAAVDVPEFGLIEAYETASVRARLHLVGEPDDYTLAVSAETLGRVDPGVRSPKTLRLPQVDLANEPAGYPGGDRILYESFAPLDPHTGVLVRTWNAGNGLHGYTAPADPLRFNRGSSLAFYSRDLGFDIPFEFSTNGHPKIKDVYIRGDADWPRASAIQIVEGRAFGIYNDAFSQFYVFPLSQIGPHDPDVPYGQNVDPTFVKKVKPTFPSWAYVNTDRLMDVVPAVGVGRAFDVAPDLDWKFSHDGKKAVVIVHEQVFPVFDAAYYAVDQGDEPYLSAYADTYRTGDANLGNRHGNHLLYNDEFAPHTSGPGLLGVEITIELTGTGMADFAVNIELTEIRRPRETSYCAMLAGFCWNDVLNEAEDDYVARAGDLCVLDVERWWKSTTATVNSFITLKNLTKDVGEDEIRSFHGDAIVAYDFSTLSFVLREVYDVTEARSFTTWPPPDDPTTFGTTVKDALIRHFGLSVWVMNKLQEVLFPDTMDEGVKTTIAAAAATQPRSNLTPPELWALLPLNDLRDWTDAELDRLRYKLASDDTVPDAQAIDDSVTHKNKHLDPGPGAPSADTLNWMLVAMHVYNDARYLIYFDQPLFGWYMYTDEIINRLWLSPTTTFFAAPNGVWAFYSSAFIYNKGGVPRAQNADRADTNTPFDATLLEHCILDRVHFTTTYQDTEYVLDTTFVGLYNMALGDDPGSKDMEPVTRAQLRAAFVKTSTPIFNYTIPPFFNFEGVELVVTLNGQTGYYLDGRLSKRVSPFNTVQYWVAGGGGTVDLTFMTNFTLLPHFDTFTVGELETTIPEFDWTRTHFSSCVLT